MTKCDHCGQYFSWWERLTGINTEHVRLCRVISILREERNVYRGELIDANIEKSKLLDALSKIRYSTKEVDLVSPVCNFDCSVCQKLSRASGLLYGEHE